MLGERQLDSMKDDVNPIKIFLIEIIIILALVVLGLYQGGMIFNSGSSICGTATFQGMEVTINQKEGSIIKVTFDNQTDTDMNIGGWSANQRACLKTTEGEYWFDFNSFMGYDIPAHSTREALLAFKNVKGTITEVKIDKIQTLVDGLPTFGISGVVEIPVTYGEGND